MTRGSPRRARCAFESSSVARSTPSPRLLDDAEGGHVVRHHRDVPRRGEDHDTGCTKPPAGKFVQVQAGNAFSCGLRPSGLVECWGNDRKGQSTPPDDVQFLQIATSNVVDHACGLTFCSASLPFDL